MADKYIQPGIALDLDDTLSDTFPHFAQLVNSKWGNPEGLTVGQIVEKYKIMLNVPFWQTDEIQGWLKEQALLNDAQEAVSVIPGALEAVVKLNEIIPVKLYITTRPSVVHVGTQRWLDKHSFPKAELITRDAQFDPKNGNEWKAAILASKFPEIVGVVDDNPAIIGAFPSGYKGTLYLYGSHPFKNEVSEAKIDVRQCKTWDEVLRQIAGKKE